MIRKDLSRRLDRLEEVMGPATEITIIHVEYIDRNGAVTPGGYTIEIPSRGCAPTPRQQTPSGSYR